LQGVPCAPRAVAPPKAARLQATPGDHGEHSFPNGVTLKTAGSRAVTLSDTVNGTIHGSATVRVTAAADLLAPAGSSPGGAGAGTDVLDTFVAYAPGFPGGVFGAGAPGGGSGYRIFFCSKRGSTSHYY
jgi:hypothetical protein